MQHKLGILAGTLLLLAALWGGVGQAQRVPLPVDNTEPDLRLLAYLSTDKPIYREEETVYLRAVVLNALDNTPYDKAGLYVDLKITGPKGDTLFEARSPLANSTAGLSWQIPAGTAGGVYRAVVYGGSQGLPETTRSFELRAYRVPRLKNQIEFLRDGYGPGDTVQVTVKSERVEGGVPKNAKVTATARLDGKQIFQRSGMSLDAEGTLSVDFTLPDLIAVGEGQVAFAIEDGGTLETATKSLPIVLQTLDISFYPESGDAVNGLANRIYFQARLPNGKPADIEGKVVARANPNQVLSESVTTEHEGRGRFTVQPQADMEYALAITKPSGINKIFSIPKAKSRGAILRSAQDSFAFNDRITLSVQSSHALKGAKLTLYKREYLVSEQGIDLSAKASRDVVLDGKESEGVLMVTLWDSNGKALAERLIYREPKYAINIDIALDKAAYTPGSKVDLTVTARDSNQQPVEAVIGLTVTDDAVLEMIDKREQAPRLPVMVHLENEALDLADAHVYLDHNNPMAKTAVDLLLGTQGWRRFVLADFKRIKAEYPEAADRILAKNEVIERIIITGSRIRAEEEVDEFAVPEAVEAPMPVLVRAKKAREPAFELQAQAIVMEDRADLVAEAEMIAFDRAAWSQIRVYAHQARPNRQPNSRVDFTETLYWHAGIKTSARDGKAKISFDLSDSVTEFRVMADGFGRNGALAAQDKLIQSVEPFYIEPKLPTQVQVGDRIDLPVVVVNASNQDLPKVSLLVQGEGFDIAQAPTIALNRDSRRRVLLSLTAQKPGRFDLAFKAAASPFLDNVTRSVVVKPAGFPVAIHRGGVLGPKTEFSTTFTIDKDRLPGTLSSSIKVYPSPLANLQEALNALLRQPYGCFEQTSSTNYPLVMAQQYFLSHQGVDPETIAKAKKLLDAGYKRLISFEASDKGYEWFGASPAHEALTAYGLMEFVDMQKIMPVDEAMITRTREWLLARRDGQGGFKRNEKALDSFGAAPAPTTNAYIVWALLESGEAPSSLAKEITAVEKMAEKSEDSYVIALAANILYLAKRIQAGDGFAQKLSDLMEENGSIGGSKTSITRSGGDALTIETTSLAILAWLKRDDKWADRTESAMRWLFERSKAGRFGSTQSTVLALKAINAYDAARAKPKVPGILQVFLNGKLYGKPLSFDAETKGALALPDISAALQPGKHQLALAMQGGSKMPFSVAIDYHTKLPVSQDAAAVDIETKLSAKRVGEGEVLNLNLSLNIGNQDAPTPIAIVGIPAGLEVRHDQLKEWVAQGKIASYEVLGKDLVLYWRALKANSRHQFAIDLIADIPGSYTGAASRAYLYYTDELKAWYPGESIRVDAKRD